MSYLIFVWSDYKIFLHSKLGLIHEIYIKNKWHHLLNNIHKIHDLINVNDNWNIYSNILLIKKEFKNKNFNWYVK